MPGAPAGGGRSRASARRAGQAARAAASGPNPRPPAQARAGDGSRRIKASGRSGPGRPRASIMMRPGTSESFSESLSRRRAAAAAAAQTARAFPAELPSCAAATTRRGSTELQMRRGNSTRRQCAGNCCDVLAQAAPAVCLASGLAALQGFDDLVGGPPAGWRRATGSTAAAAAHVIAAAKPWQRGLRRLVCQCDRRALELRKASAG